MNVFPRNGPEYAQFVAMALQPEPDATLRDLRMQSVINPVFRGPQEEDSDYEDLDDSSEEEEEPSNPHVHITSEKRLLAWLKTEGFQDAANIVELLKMRDNLSAKEVQDIVKVVVEYKKQKAEEEKELEMV